MMMDDPTSEREFATGQRWITRHRQVIKRQRVRDKAAETRWTWSRLLMFLGAAVVAFSLRHAPTQAVAACGSLLVLFAVSVGYHRRALERREFADRLLIIIDESLQRCGAQVTLVRSFDRPTDPMEQAACLNPIFDDGSTWTLTDQEREDLDVHVPPVGLFGLLNRTSTAIGGRRLRDMIDHPLVSIDRILARQEAVRWLDQHPTERFRMMAAAVTLRERRETLDSFVTATRQATPLPTYYQSPLLRIWSIGSGLFTLVAIAQTSLGRYGWGAAFLALLAINGLVCLRMRRTLNAVVGAWRDLGPVAECYVAAADQAAHDLPDTTQLQVLRQRCQAVVRRDILPSLARRLRWTERGGMLYDAINALMFYDLHVASAILGRVLPNREALITGLKALGELEAFMSLACFASESASGGATCYPKPAEDLTLAIKTGYHPLIDPKHVVPNDVTLTTATPMWIISGSNMAGKSTLLRMVGTNVLLAQIGTVVMARDMTWAPMRIVTDLRANDSLAASESYFLTEVRHIRRMVLPPDGDTPMLGLIDEPFRGTNSEEQVAASLAVAQHLLESNGLFLIATHERRLMQLAERTAAQSFHFHENIDGDRLVFDYHLYAGQAMTRNALSVLEREGYPPAVVAQARNWLASSPKD